MIFCTRPCPRRVRLRRRRPDPAAVRLLAVALAAAGVGALLLFLPRWALSALVMITACVLWCVLRRCSY